MRRLGWLAIAALLASGLALAQKPPPAGQPTTPGRAAPAAPPPPTAAPPAEPIPADEPQPVTWLRRMLGPGATLRYGSAVVTDPARGALRMARVSIGLPGQPLITILNLTLDEVREDSIGDVDMVGLVAREADTQLRIGRVQAKGLTVGPLSPGGRRLLGQLSLAELRAENLSVTATEGAGLTLEQVLVEDFGAGRLNKIGLSRLDLRFRPGESVNRLTLRRAAIQGADLATIANALAQKQVQPNTGRTTIELDQLAATNAERPVFSLASLRLAGEQPENGIGTASLALREMRIETPQAEANWLKRLGYPFAQFDLTLTGRYDPAIGLLELPSLALAARGMATAELSLNLDGMTMAKLQGQNFGQIRLLSGGLRLVDQGVYGRLLNSFAVPGQVTETQLREAWANLAGGLLASPSLTPLREALQRFLRRETREVSLAVNPVQPVSMLGLQQTAPGGLDALALLLGLEAR